MICLSIKNIFNLSLIFGIMNRPLINNLSTPLFECREKRYSFWLCEKELVWIQDKLFDLLVAKWADVSKNIKLADLVKAYGKLKENLDMLEDDYLARLDIIEKMELLDLWILIKKFILTKNIDLDLLRDFAKRNRIYKRIW